MWKYLNRWEQAFHKEVMMNLEKYARLLREGLGSPGGQRILCAHMDDPCRACECGQHLRLLHLPGLAS